MQYYSCFEQFCIYQTTRFTAYAKLNDYGCYKRPHVHVPELSDFGPCEYKADKKGGLIRPAQNSFGRLYLP